MLRMVGVWGGVGSAPRPFVAHPTGYPWRVGRLQSPLPLCRLGHLPFLCSGVEAEKPYEQGLSWPGDRYTKT